MFGVFQYQTREEDGRRGAEEAGEKGVNLGLEARCVHIIRKCGKGQKGNFIPRCHIGVHFTLQSLTK